MVLVAPLQHSAESKRAFGPTFGSRDYQLVTNGGLVAIDTDQYHILQRVGGHWSPLIQIATDVGSRWEKSEFLL